MLVLWLSGCGLLPGGDGDGELVAFHPLGSRTDEFDPRGEAGELSAAQRSVPDVLAGLGLGTPDQGADALADLPSLSDDDRRFAFVLGGCQQDSARLTVDGAHLGAEAVGNEEVSCAQEAFFLAVFDVPAEDLPAAVELP